MKTGAGRDVLIIGGGMAGCTAAWELSHGDWRTRHRSITLLEASDVLGGKGASTRGDDGRILEHGLHVWLGYYDNAFRLLRDCYAELDRPTTDPSCPIQTWRDAFMPANDVGVFERTTGDDGPWYATFPTNDLVPGSESTTTLSDLIDRALAMTSAAIGSGLDPGRATALVDLVGTLLRGISHDGLLAGGGGFERVDDEDFRAWLRRHGAREATVVSGLVRGMYDLVFAYRGGERTDPAFSAGLGVFLAVRMFFDYKGAIFWKMTAGMGDVVFAPLHEVLLRRGVSVRLGHRVEHMDIVDDEVDRIRLTAPASPVATLTRHDDLPVYVHASSDGTERSALEWSRGTDFDTVVLAASLADIEDLSPDLASRPPWRRMLDEVATVATWAVQLWLRPTDDELGTRTGATTSGLEAPLDTMASMSHLLGRESWTADAPRSLSYLCASSPDGDLSPADVEHAVDVHLAAHGSSAWPGRPITALDHPDVRAHFCVRHDTGSARYVQSLPGTGASRLRVDESGVGGLVLAGDWTDCGLNAGCIEAAVVSGVQAAAAVEGRPLTDRVIGPLTWDFR